MTNNKLTDERLMQIADAAEAVLSALAGTNDDVHPESDDMIRLWDELNDDWATPEVVRDMAIEIQERRKADSEPVALRWRWNDNAAQWTYAPASKMPEFVAAGFSQNNGVEIEYLYAAPQPALQPSVGFVDATGTDCECVCPACKHEFSIQFEY
ncbi:hypothetical protein AVF70_000701 [Salmonella enterica subsp. enterica]|nr:hypothetical protein [Salmonella enterica subsp. enterica]